MPLYWTNPETAELIVNIAGSFAEMVQKETNIPLFHNHLTNTALTLSSFDEILKAIDKVEAVVCDMEGYPGDYLRDTVRGFRGLHSFLTKKEGYTFLDAQRDIMGIDFKPIPENVFEKFYSIVDGTLTELGYTGTPGEKIGKWQDDHRIPSEDVKKVAEQFLEKSRAAAKERVISHLPAGECVFEVETVHDMPWSGYSYYFSPYRSKLAFNIDRPWNAPSFANILTHEGYPGHHVVQILWDQRYNNGEFPYEAAYYLDSAPNNALFEGVPEVGVRFIGWDDPNVDTPELTAQEKHDIILSKNIMDLQRLYQTTACYMYNVEKKSAREVVKYMVDTGWYSEVEAQNSLRMFKFSFGSIYYPGYFYGRWLVQNAYDAIPVEKRPELFHLLYETPQTNKTLIDAVKKLTGNNEFEPYAGVQ